MLRLAMLASLAAYATVVSQPLAYILFLTRAQRALSAPAYVELRRRINPVMNRRVPIVYLIALSTLLLVLALSLGGGSWTTLGTASLALVALAVDLVMALRGNAPINEVMDRWSATDYPEDWQDYRDRWFAVFARRQSVLLVGFLGLLIGAVYG